MHIFAVRTSVLTLLLFFFSPDFRTRASSNASSCSRLSPIPVEPEWTMNYNYMPPDQLAGTLEQHMKINGGSENYIYSPYSAQTTPSPASTYSRTPFGGGGQVTANSSSQNCLLHPHQSCNCSSFLTDLRQVVYKY